MSKEMVEAGAAGTEELLRSKGLTTLEEVDEDSFCSIKVFSIS